MILDSFMFTDPGGRDENQDYVGKRELKDAGLYLLADGLGGHRLGNLASETAITSMLSSWREDKLWTPEYMRECISKANESVRNLQREKNCAAKSTIVALAIKGKNAIWAHCGDSRLYFIYKGKIVAVTEDHSVAYRKYKAGEITREEIAWDEDQSSLLRALGNESRWKPNISGTEKLREGVDLLLCSDGFWEYITDQEILDDNVETKSAVDWGEKMLKRVQSRFKPGNDNYSLITVKVK